MGSTVVEDMPVPDGDVSSDALLELSSSPRFSGSVATHADRTTDTTHNDGMRLNVMFEPRPFVTATIRGYHGIDMALGAWCSVALAAVLVAAAETPEVAPVRLAWTAPAECPDADTVLGWVRALAPVEGTAVATGTIDREGSDFVLALEISGDVKVSRTLRAPDCMVVGRAAAVVIAVSLDPIAVAQSIAVTTAITQDVPEPAPIDEPVVPEPVRTVAPRVSAPRPIERSDAAIEYGASIGVGVEGLLLPSVGPGFAIAPFVGTRRIHVEATVQYWTPRTTRTPDTDGVQARVQMVSAGLRACPLIERGRLRIPLCAGIDAGAVLARADGSDVRNADPVTAPWAGVVLAPGVRFAVAPRVSLGVAVEGVISLYIPFFEVQGVRNTIYQMGRGGLRGVFYVQLHSRLQKK